MHAIDFEITCIGGVWINGQQVDIQRHRSLCGKRHFRRRCEQAPVRFIVIGQYMTRRAQSLQSGKRVFQHLRIVQIRHIIERTDLPAHLRENRLRHALFARRDINE